jgi:hypothetical protein
MSFNYTLDHPSYIEKRMRQGDEAEARLDAVVGQSLRKALAISDAVKRLRAVEAENSEGLLSRASINEMLERIALDLEQANKVRETDPTPEQLERVAEESHSRAMAKGAHE